MDLNDFAIRQLENGVSDDEAAFSCEQPISLSSWQAKNVRTPTAWEEVFEGSKECRHPILMSEPGRKVVRAIRQIYTARQPTNRNQHMQTQASEYYLVETQNAPRRNLSFTQDTNNLQTLSSESSCGIKQRLQTKMESNARKLPPHSNKSDEESHYLTKTDESPEEGSNNSAKQSFSANKRKLQQSPITNYFQDRKDVQMHEFKKAKQAIMASQNENARNSLRGKSKPLKVSLMSPSQREEFEQHLKSAEEVACTLVYEEGWSLLRPKKQKTKKQAENTTSRKVVGLVIALPWPEVQPKQYKSRLAFVEIPLDAENQSLIKWCRQVLDNLMSSSTTKKLCYDAQKIVRCLVETAHYDVRKVCLKWRLLDPKVAAWLLNPDYPPQTFAEVLLSVELQLSGEDEEKDGMTCGDIAMLGPLMLKQYNKLKMLALWDLFINIETPLCTMLAVMETQGIGINSQVLIDASDTLKLKIQKVEAEAHKVAGHPFLINSPQQLREVLFEELRLDQKCKRKLARTSIKNQKSTSEAVLLHLQELHPLPKLVLQYRHLVKLKSTYFDGILYHVSEGVLFTKWDQTAAATGRLTSANPNLQAIPKQVIEVSGIRRQLIVGKPEEVTTIYARDAYSSRFGWLLLAADFQSIELRLLSHLSEDPTLIRTFNDNASADVFTALASQWLRKSLEEVQFQDRERTKRIVYSVIYGVGSEKLGHTLQVSADEAKGFMESFLGKFPRIKEFSKRTIESCQVNGYVSTLLKRRRWLPHIKSHDYAQQSQAERQAVNFVVQGSAADICKAAMIQVVDAISGDSSIHARLLLQIHDELLLEVPEDEIKIVTGYLDWRKEAKSELLEVPDLSDGDFTVAEDKTRVKSIMECTEKLCGGTVKLKVPLRVSISVGKTWGHMETFSDQ